MGGKLIGFYWDYVTLRALGLMVLVKRPSTLGIGWCFHPRDSFLAGTAVVLTGRLVSAVRKSDICAKLSEPTSRPDVVGIPYAARATLTLEQFQTICSGPLFIICPKNELFLTFGPLHKNLNCSD
jgi:hypothetical protein